MKRTFNIGTECYGLITNTLDPEFLLPVKIILLEKYSMNDNTTYKVKIRDIFESDFDYLKEHLSGLRVSNSLKTESNSRIPLIRKSKLNSITNKTELLTCLNDKPFFLEDNYITLDKEGLKDLYLKFVKYIINFHYERLYQLTSRSFLGNTPLFENQKDIFIRRVEKIGFGDIFNKADFKLEI